MTLYALKTDVDVQTATLYNTKRKLTVRAASFHDKFLFFEFSLHLTPRRVFIMDNYNSKSVPSARQQIELNVRGSKFPVELGCKLERVIELTHAKATEISKARKKGLHTYEIDICNGAWIIHIKRQNGIHYCYDVWFRPMILKAA
ncbi:MAG: hypothetical protein AN487_20685 [Anabaena sp. CRKS33]|nr:MAG: hypothetical protein AN487_20685 [Anabaena sp. CRKS33]